MGARESELLDYERSEVIRQSLQDVKKNAIAQQITRVSPKKLYSGVKSKVAANRRSIERAKKIVTYSNYFRAQENEREE